MRRHRPAQRTDRRAAARSPAAAEALRGPLPIPPIKAPVRTDATTDYYEIAQRQAEVEILPGTRTPIFGYDGIFPGPTIASRSGRRTIVRHTNELPVPTVVHLHGGRTPPDSDGYPIDLVLPTTAGARAAFVGYPGGLVVRGHRDYVDPLQQRAATLWYHDHRMDFSGPQSTAGWPASTSSTTRKKPRCPCPAESGTSR